MGYCFFFKKKIIDDAHVKLLDPADSSLAMERELLTTDTKLELLLAASDDLEKFATQVRQVKSLEHVVSGSEYDGKYIIKYVYFKSKSENC